MSFYNYPIERVRASKSNLLSQIAPMRRAAFCGPQSFLSVASNS